MTRSTTSLAFLALAAVGAITGACGSDDTASGSAGTVNVESSNTACTPSPSTINAGKVTLTVNNTGGSATELYVYDGDKILGEVENIGPGTNRDMTVTFDAGGTYTLVCKPGQKGDGIKAPITVTP